MEDKTSETHEKEVSYVNVHNATTKVAGILYLAIIATSMLEMVIGTDRFVIEGDSLGTFFNMKKNQSIVHFAAIYEIIMFSSVFALSVALYLLLERVNRGLAMVAMFWRIGEAIFGFLMVLLDPFTLMVLFKESDKPNANMDNIIWFYDLTQGFIKQVITIVFVLLGLGTFFNFYLFYKGRLVPNWLSILGMISFFISAITGLINIAIETDILMMFQAPAVIFEFSAGIYLIFYGIKERKVEKEE